MLPPFRIPEQADPLIKQAGKPANKGERFEYLKKQLDYFAKELKEKRVNRKLLWQEYRQDYPDGYSYTQFCFHLAQ